MKTNKNKVGFGIGALLTVGLTLVVTGIVLAFGQNVMGEVVDDMCAYGYNSTAGQCLNASSMTSATADSETAEVNSTEDAMSGVGNLTEKFGLIATVSVAAIIVGVLMTAFAIRGLSG